jgi:hypothetical protein
MAPRRHLGHPLYLVRHVDGSHSLELCAMCELVLSPLITLTVLIRDTGTESPSALIALAPGSRVRVGHLGAARCVPRSAGPGGYVK